MFDFTINTYLSFLQLLKSSGYHFQTLTESLTQLQTPNSKLQTFSPNYPKIILRHDVDKLPQNSLEFAKIQYKLGIKASYYFRMVPESFDENIIRQISDMGHEIGYHYEDMDLVRKDNGQRTIDHEKETMDNRPWTIDSRKLSENNSSLQIEENQPSSIVHRPSSLHQQAIELFKKNLSKLREIAPISTICMHGSPRSPIDNKELWKYYDYRDYGIIGEPYFDIDFSKIAYYTDTGRMWDGDKYSVRDRVDHRPWTIDNKVGKDEPGTLTNDITSHPLTPSSPHPLIPTSSHPLISSSSLFPSYHSTQNIITALQNNTFPKQAMFTFHPQRWTNNLALWTKELILQSAKNVIKRYFFIKK